MSVKVSSSVQRMATGHGKDRPEIRVHQPTSPPSESVTTNNTGQEPVLTSQEAPMGPIISFNQVTVPRENFTEKHSHFAVQQT
jgi:hypothetical protein